MAKLKSKFIEENIFRVLMWMCVGIVLLVVLSIVWTIFVKGFGSISWEMIFVSPIALDNASTTAANIPDNDLRSTTRLVVCQVVAPNDIDASLRS